MKISRIQLSFALLAFCLTTALAQKPSKPAEGKQTKPLVFEVTDQKPEFPGGAAALADFISNNMQTPEQVLNGSLSGTTVTKFVVKTDGTIEDIDIIKPVPGCKDCDEEAIRLLILMPKWNPGKLKGIAVNATHTLSFNFQAKPRK